MGCEIAMLLWNVLETKKESVYLRNSLEDRTLSSCANSETVPSNHVKYFPARPLHFTAALF